MFGRVNAKKRTSKQSNIYIKIATGKLHPKTLQIEMQVKSMNVT